MPICVGGDAGDADVRGDEYVRVSGFRPPPIGHGGTSRGHWGSSSLHGCRGHAATAGRLAEGSGFQLGIDVAVLFEVHRLIDDGPPPWAV